VRRFVGRGRGRPPASTTPAQGQGGATGTVGQDRNVSSEIGSSLSLLDQAPAEWMPLGSAAESSHKRTI
jgi:hypothetical protein